METYCFLIITVSAAVKEKMGICSVLGISFPKERLPAVSPIGSSAE